MFATHPTKASMHKPSHDLGTGKLYASYDHETKYIHQWQIGASVLPLLRHTSLMKEKAGLDSLSWYLSFCHQDILVPCTNTLQRRKRNYFSFQILLEIVLLSCYNFFCIKHSLLWQTIFQTHDNIPQFIDMVKFHFKQYSVILQCRRDVGDKC